MKPIEFLGQNVIYAKDQPEYLPLPAYVDRSDPTGRAVSCWKMDWRERIKVILTGRIYLQLLTFQQPLQPQIVSVDSPLADIQFNASSYEKAMP